MQFAAWIGNPKAIEILANFGAALDITDAVERKLKEIESEFCDFSKDPRHCIWRLRVEMLKRLGRCWTLVLTSTQQMKYLTVQTTFRTLLVSSME